MPVRLSSYNLPMRPNPSQLLKTAKLNALLITDLTNIFYLTGVRLTSGIVLVTPRTFHLFVDPRYTEAATKSARSGVRVRPVADIEGVLSQIKRCGFESADVTVARLKGWESNFKSTKFVQTSGLTEGFRRQKDPDEISAMMRSRRIAWEIVRRVPGVLRKGITEAALSWKMEEWARELGAQKMSFETIVAFGPHTSRPHHRPTTKALKKGDIVQVDLGVVYKGYCSDVSDVFFTARPTEHQEHCIGALREAKNTAAKLLAPGVAAAAVDKAARAVLTDAGIEEAFTHALGHGVGLEVHEGVTLSGRSKQKLLEHEIVTLEPGVYFPGKFGMRVEDMYLIA